MSEYQSLEDALKMIVQMHNRTRRRMRGEDPYKYASYEDYVLDMGTQYGFNLKDKETGIPNNCHLQNSVNISREAKLCFQNAYTIATGNDAYWGEDGIEAFSYVEGFASSARLGGIPIHHAWLVSTECGCIYDPTWGSIMQVGELSMGQYIGVEFSDDDLRNTAVNTGVYGIFYDHQNGDPLLKDGVPHDG